MKILQLLPSPSKEHLLADIGNGRFVTRKNSMELAICEKNHDGSITVRKTVVAGMMMRTFGEFYRCVEMLNESQL
jgi:hypothetical protein